MNPRLPVISGEQAVKAFSRIGYQKIRQKGSHVRLRHPTDVNKRPLTIPLHKELKPALLRRLISDANLTREEFMDLLR